MRLKLNLSQKGLILVCVPLAFELVFVFILAGLLQQAEHEASRHARSKEIVANADSLISGYELARFLRQDERYATLPVLFLTTQSQIIDRIRAARAGGDEHLAKPVVAPLLVSSVAARLERVRFLKSLLHRDGLTRLLTHTGFMERAAAVSAQASGSTARPACMLLLDVDGFRSINERFGHVTGDKVLVSLANMLRRRLRQSDIMGRYGADAVSIIAEDLDRSEAICLGEHLVREFSEITHEAGDGRQFRASVSAGVAMLDWPSTSVSEWCNAAQLSLDKAREAGGNSLRPARAGEDDPARLPDRHH